MCDLISLNYFPQSILSMLWKNLKELQGYKIHIYYNSEKLLLHFVFIYYDDANSHRCIDVSVFT